MRKRIFSTYMLIWVIAIISIVGIISFSFRIFGVDEIEEAEAVETYTYHYVMIVEDTESSFWKDVYESAKAEGEKSDAFVELLGDNINKDYTVSELLEIAIYQQVDGILLEPSLEENIEDLINEAVNKGIPVITMVNDIHTSKRQTFVGISKYNLGEKYGDELIKIIRDEGYPEDMSIVFLEPKRDIYSNDEQIFSGITSTIEYTNVNMKLVEVNNGSEFGSEEFIRNIVMETTELVDAIVCVDVAQTESTCQAVIDFNKVGEIRIVGYFVSDIILDAIETGVMDATFVVDTKEIGEEGVRSLIEFYENNRVTNYVSINIEKIDASNVAEYREKLLETDEEMNDEDQ